MNNGTQLQELSLSAKERIEWALISLLRTRELKEIKVAEVIALAEVSKSTFYRNYHDVFEIYENLLGRLTAKAARVVMDLFINSDSSLDTDKFISELKENFLKIGVFPFDEKDFFVLFDSISKNDLSVINFIYEKIYEELLDIFSKRWKNEEDLSFFIKFLVKSALCCFISDLYMGNEFDFELFHIYKEFFDELKNGR